jgi:predicted alpha-1,2-mannosidase
VSLLACLVAMTMGLSACSTAKEPPNASLGVPKDVVRDPASYVNPFIGTGSGGPIVGEINLFPGADVPFGMIQWSPQTNNPDPSQTLIAGYEQGADEIEGFGLNYLSGAGCTTYGNVPIMAYPGIPQVAPLKDPSAYWAHFSPKDSSASPGSYRVAMGNGVRVSLAVASRAGVGSFSFPAGKPATMIFYVSTAENPVSQATARVVGDDEVVGSVTSGDFCGHPSPYTLYFAARFQKPFSSSGTWSGYSLTPGATSVSSVLGGLYVSFPRCACKDVVRMQVGISYTGTKGALANLASAHLGFSVHEVAAKARARWNSLLLRIQVAGGTKAQRTVFYTALYHALLYPSLFSDADGLYIGFDDKLHKATRLAQYANFSEWDIYRCEIPLLSLLVPNHVSAMMQSLVRDAEQNGQLPRWALANWDTPVMGGDSADPIIANALAYGVKGFDIQEALHYMVRGASEPGASKDGTVERPGLRSYLAHGYVPDSLKVSNETSSVSPDGASLTLEYAEDDFAISRVAKLLGHPRLAVRFLVRSGNWRNVFDPRAGQVVPRTKSGAFVAGWPKGSFTEEKDLARFGVQGVGQEGFQEGDSAQYTWLVPQDLKGLFKEMGGDAVVRRRLDAYFEHLNAGPDAPYDWAGNEQDLEVPWEGDYAGDPALTASVVHRILTRYYTDSPSGEPGNDDLGAISSWAVWGMLGLYPETPGVPVLVTGSPTFPWVRIHLSRARTLTIVAKRGHRDLAKRGHRDLAKRGHPDAIYVKSLVVDGKQSQRPWVSLPALSRRATLVFTLGTKDDYSWGTAKADAPPSFPSER